jgi:hypothetical protein
MKTAPIKQTTATTPATSFTYLPHFEVIPKPAPGANVVTPGGMAFSMSMLTQAGQFLYPR